MPCSSMQMLFSMTSPGSGKMAMQAEVAVEQEHRSVRRRHDMAVVGHPHAYDVGDTLLELRRQARREVLDLRDSELAPSGRCRPSS